MAYNRRTSLNTFHLFSGAGGGILADLLLGHNPIGACEIEPYPRDVLLARQRDGHLPAFPIWDDVCTLDGTPWRGTVDVLCGGFPCQDISAAGKGAGISGERSGLWKEYARLIGEMRPRFVFAENSPLLRTRGLGVVLEDLAALGYDARWGVLGARDVGAPHERDRMWVLAYKSTNSISFRPQEGNGEQRISFEPKLGPAKQVGSAWASPVKNRWMGLVPSECIRVDDGVANRVDRLKAIGNGQVPQCAAMAFSILSEGLI